MNLPEFFVIEHSEELLHYNDKPEAEGWLPEYTYNELRKVINMNFNDTTPIEEYFSNLQVIYEDGIEYEYSLGLGAFVKTTSGWSLEEEFESMAEAYADLVQYSMDEYSDFIYRPYVMVELRIPRRR